VRRAAIAGFLVSATLAGGCGGYQDDNWRAAREVAQAYLDAQQREDTARACGLLAPETQASFAALGGGACEAGVPSASGPAGDRRLNVAGVTPVPGSGLNPRMGVRVREQPARLIVVGRYGSTWRVVDVGATPAG